MFKKTKYQQKKNKRNMMLILSAIIFIATLAVTIWLYFYLMQNLRIKEVVFIGNQHINKEYLHEFLKIRGNDPLYSISSRQMHKNLMQSPWVKDVRVRKELSGRILIQLSEAVPAAILYKSKKPYFIDSSGVILEEIPEPSVIFLPVIMEIDPLKNQDTYKEALALINLLKEKKPMSHTGQIEITGRSRDDLTIKVDDIFIKIGYGDYEKKIERLEKIKEEIKNRNIAIEYIDLRFSEQIIVKPLKQ